MAADSFNSLAAVSGLIAASATLFALKQGLSAKLIIRVAVIYCLILIPLTGAVTGSFDSQGVNIPWWVFGLMNAALSFFSVSLTLVIRLLIVKKS